MMMRGWILGILYLLFVSCNMMAQIAETPPAFPSNMLNSGGLNFDDLKGKVVVLYFFEEQCPRCAKYWPELLEMANSYHDQPVLFVGINSGQTTEEVTAYGRDMNVDWPLIVDTDRSYEQAWGIKPVSLNNIKVFCVVKPDGSIENTEWRNPKQEIDKALPDAKWNVDPATVPESFEKLWRSMEFGDYKTALPQMTKLKNDPSAPEGLYEQYNEQISLALQLRIKQAQKLEQEEGVWPAFQFYDQIVEDFRMLSSDESVRTAKRERSRLLKEEKVRNERAAALKFKKYKVMFWGRTRKIYEQGRDGLKAITQDYPGTEAAALAQELLSINR